MQNSIIDQAKVGHEIEQIWFSTRKKNITWFFTFLNVYVSWIERDKILISQLTPSKLRYFADQNGPKEDPVKINFGNFQIVSQTVNAQEVDEKNGVICLISIFVSWVTVLKLPEIVHFLQICADHSKKPKYIKVIYFYSSERPHHAVSENSIFYRGPRY